MTNIVNMSGRKIPQKHRFCFQLNTHVSFRKVISPITKGYDNFCNFITYNGTQPD